MLLTVRQGARVAMVWAHSGMADRSMWGMACDDHAASLVRHIVLGSLWLHGGNLSGGSGGAG